MRESDPGVQRRLKYEDEDVEDHTRPHPDAAPSGHAAPGTPQRPTLPLADPEDDGLPSPEELDEWWRNYADELRDSPQQQPPQPTEYHDISSIHDSSGTSPLNRDYDADDSSNDSRDTIPYYQEELHQFLTQDLITGNEKDPVILHQLEKYIEECGTQAFDDAIDINVLCAMESHTHPPSSTAHEVGTIMEKHPEAHQVDSLADPSATTDMSPPELHLTRDFSLLYAAYSGEVLPTLGPEEHYVLRIYAGGVKRTVVQREANLLDANEARKYPEQVRKAMLE